MLRIQDAHQEPNGGWKYYGKRTGANNYLGIEWETEPKRGHREGYVTVRHALNMLESFSDNMRYAVPSHDGSLCAEGIEWRLQPTACNMLLAKMRTGYALLEAANYTAKYTGSYYECGMHIHISLDNFGVTQYARNVGALKMCAIISRFSPKADTETKRYLSAVCGRNDWYWCGLKRLPDYIDIDEWGKKPLTNAAFRIVDENKTSKYQALNFQHDKSFELRIFAGQPTFTDFAHAIKFVNAWVTLTKAKNRSYEWFHTCSWDEFIEAVKQTHLNRVDASDFNFESWIDGFKHGE